jgi:hypothetical protein
LAENECLLQATGRSAGASKRTPRRFRRFAAAQLPDGGQNAAAGGPAVARWLARRGDFPTWSGGAHSAVGGPTGSPPSVPTNQRLANTRAMSSRTCSPFRPVLASGARTFNFGQRSRRHLAAGQAPAVPHLRLEQSCALSSGKGRRGDAPPLEVPTVRRHYGWRRRGTSAPFPASTRANPCQQY